MKTNYYLHASVKSCFIALFTGLSSFYSSAITITTISPTSGSTNGGTLVTINGSGYIPSLNSIMVDFGGISVPGTRISNSKITAATPPHISGLVNIVVSVVASNGNASSATKLNAYTYNCPPVGFDFSYSAILCNGESSTVAISNPSGGLAPYSGIGNFSQAAGPYIYTVQDANGCAASTTGEISEPALLEVFAAFDPIMCHGGSTLVMVSASGGTLEYTGIGNFKHDAGRYEYEIRDANGCTATVSGEISEPELLVASAYFDPIMCHGGSTEVQVMASGGTLVYSGIGNFEHAAGNFEYEVTDANSCTASTSGIISEPELLVAFAAFDPIMCHGGSTLVMVSASGGTLEYSGIGNFDHAVGSYEYEVSDTNGCTATVSGEISEPEVLVASAYFDPIMCHGGSTEVQVTASGGTLVYSGIGNFEHAAGSFEYEVTDANGCTASASGVISEPELLVAFAAFDQIMCHGGSTLVMVSASGGTLEYSGIGNFDHPEGNYEYEVSDANGCTASVTGEISEPELLVASTYFDPIMCHGGSTVVQVTASGGTLVYSGIGNFEHAAGSFEYEVTDANGCTASTSGEISEPEALVASLTYDPILCNGESTVVHVSALGGTPDYSGTGDFPHEAGLCAHEISDANGCIATVTDVIAEPESMSVIVQNSNPELFFGYSSDQSSVITVTPSGGEAPYLVSISMNRPLQCNVQEGSGDEAFVGDTGGTDLNTNCPETGGLNLAPVSFKSIDDGSYSATLSLMAEAEVQITVTDANGCESKYTTQISAQDVRCFNGSDVRAKILLCHYTGSATNECVQLCVDESAVQEHLDHGDALGECESVCLPSNNLKVLNTKESLEARAFPNPTEDLFTIEIDSESDENIDVIIYDLNGRIVSHYNQLSTRELQVGRDLNSGTYIAIIYQGMNSKQLRIIKN